MRGVMERERAPDAQHATRAARTADPRRGSGYRTRFRVRGGRTRGEEAVTGHGCVRGGGGPAARKRVTLSGAVQPVGVGGTQKPAGAALLCRCGRLGALLMLDSRTRARGTRQLCTRHETSHYRTAGSDRADRRVPRCTQRSGASTYVLAGEGWRLSWQPGRAGTRDGQPDGQPGRHECRVHSDGGPGMAGLVSPPPAPAAQPSQHFTAQEASRAGPPQPSPRRAAAHSRPSAARSPCPANALSAQARGAAQTECAVGGGAALSEAGGAGATGGALSAEQTAAANHAWPVQGSASLGAGPAGCIHRPQSWGLPRMRGEKECSTGKSWWCSSARFRACPPPAPSQPVSRDRRDRRPTPSLARFACTRQARVAGAPEAVLRVRQHK